MKGTLVSPAPSSPQAVGYDVLGPIYSEFFARMHAYARPHDERARLLFVARAGVRLRRLYLAWCEGRGIEPVRSEVLWTSRLLATKALYGVDDDLFFESVLREFREETVGQFTRALGRQSAAPKLGPLRKRPVNEMRGLLADGKMPKLHAFLVEEAESARAYLSSMLDGEDSLVLLVDSGWHGTIQRLLRPTAKASLASLLVARVHRGGEPMPTGGPVTGLIVESDVFDPTRPESALVHHRHLLEAPLEPPSPSVESVRRTDDGFDIPSMEGSDRTNATSAADQMFLGVEEYLQANSAVSLHQISSDFVRAAQLLAQMIMFPSKDNVNHLDMGLRSSDFGRENSAAVLMPPVDRGPADSADKRIRDSLWAQGQAVLEYGESGAAGILHDLAGASAADDYFHPWTSGRAKGATGSVAVVTRTKNRPILLRRAAESVASQTYRDFEWVIVNDGGDLSVVLDVVRRSLVPRSAITIVSNAVSVGMEAASNLGAGSVDSTYLTIHDDDDSWDKNFLAETVAFLSEKGDDYVGVVTGTTYVSEEIVADRVEVRSSRPYNPWLRSINLAEMAAGNLFAPIAFVFKREIYEKAGRYPEDLPVLGDWDFNLRALMLGDIGVLNKPLANYHHRDVGSSGAYGNSVIAGREKHLEFDAKVRNALYRRMASGDGLGHLALVSYVYKGLRDEVRTVGRAQAAKHNKTPARISNDVDRVDSDLLWVAMTALAAGGSTATGRPSRLARRRPTLSTVPLDLDSVRQLAAGVDPAVVPAPPDFDEAAYLAEHPDVRTAVNDDQHLLGTGWEHFLRYGRAEGRRRPLRRVKDGGRAS